MPAFCVLPVRGLTCCVSPRFSGPVLIVHIGVPHFRAGLLCVAGPWADVLCQPTVLGTGSDCSDELLKNRPATARPQPGRAVRLWVPEIVSWGAVSQKCSGVGRARRVGLPRVGA